MVGEDEHAFALYHACERGQLRVAEALLADGGRLTQLHRDGALVWAACFGHAACCALLTDRGADIHYGEEAALQCASQFGHLETVACLLDRGADAWSVWALQAATDNHHGAVVALLLARRRDGLLADMNRLYGSLD